MPIIDRYLGKIILQYTLLSMAALLALFTFINFIEQIGALGNGNYNLPQALAYVLLSIPGLLYELLPMAALLGTIIGLSLLANASELIVIRASGVSILQITAAALKVGGLFVIAAVLVGEVIAPLTTTRAERGRAQALQQNIQQQTHSGLWMRDTHTYVNIGEVLPDLTLLRIKLFEFDSEHNLRAMVTAEHGQFQDGGWLIDNVNQTRIDAAAQTDTMQLPSVQWASTITPQILSIFLIQPAQLSFWQLGRYIKHLNANQQETGAFELTFWGKLMLPLSTAVMVVLAIPFVFVSIRAGRLGRSLFIGIMLGLGFYAANKGLGYVVLANGLSPLLGATMPTIALLLLALIMLRRVG